MVVVITAIEGVVLVIFQGLLYGYIARSVSATNCFQFSSFALVVLRMTIAGRRITLCTDIRMCSVPMPWLTRYITSYLGVMSFMSMALSARTIPEAIAYTSVNILIAEASPPQMRGLVNGMASAAASAGRAAAPLLTSTARLDLSAYLLSDRGL